MYIGIDTSCYTTSLAVINLEGSVLTERKILLRVKPGERGLRQSEAVFQHLQNLPQLVEDIKERFSITAVTASVRPRPVSGSYLPVFKVGAAFGETLARLMGVSYYETSHQEGHLRAGFLNQGLPDEQFLTWHLSGGTTELLLVKPLSSGYSIQKIGGTSDLQVGQFIDRVGVALGSDFPAGVFLEQLAEQSDSTESLPVVTQGLTVSFSGPDSAAGRLMGSNITPSQLARRVFNCISLALTKVTLEAVRETKTKMVLMVGGVASNNIIRTAFLRNEAFKDIKLIFAAKELSSDNAVGVGLIGYDLDKKGLKK